MSMTIEPAVKPSIAQYARYALAALSLWFAGLLVFTYFFAPTASVLVIGASEAAVLRAITNSDVALLDGTGGAFRVAGSSRNYVRQLYAGGAWLVLPISNGGCRSPRPNRLS